jgi:hypothetical protein
VVWWIVLGVVVLALVILLASMLVVAGRLRPLNRAGRRLQIRADEAERLQARVTVMQERVAALQPGLERLTERAAAQGGSER